MDQIALLLRCFRCVRRVGINLLFNYSARSIVTCKKISHHYKTKLLIMKWNKFLACLLSPVFICSYAISQTTNPAIESKVSQLLKQMTLEEKVGQMAQVSIESLGSSKGQVFSFSDKMKDAV